MTILYIVLFILSLICLGMATFGEHRKVNLIALGLVFFVAVFLIQTIDAVI